jgi:hypothetical protein
VIERARKNLPRQVVLIAKITSRIPLPMRNRSARSMACDLLYSYLMPLSID